MNFLFDVALVAISLVFLTILGIISGVAIPGLFLAAAAPWLDWAMPGRKKSRTAAPDEGRP